MEKNILSHRKWIARQFVFEGLLQELDSHFKRMDVSYMPIKGAYLIVMCLAEHIYSRRMLDIDILVRPEDFETVCDYFARCEKATFHEDLWEFEQPFYYRFNGLSIHVEIHKMINRPERFYLPTEELYARSVLKGDVLRVPGREDALLIAMCHALVHLGYYFHMDVFKDMAAITSCGDFKWDRFWKGAKKTGIKRFIEFLFLLHPDKKLLSEARCGYRRSLKAWKWLYEHVYASLPPLGKRVLFELPFARQPIKLIWQSVREKGGTSRRHASSAKTIL